MKYNLLYLVLLFSLLSISCRKGENQIVLPSVTGGMNDVLVIMSTSNWESAPGEALRIELEKPIASLPNDEQTFNLIWLPHESFSRAVRKQRNILITKIGPDYQPKITYQRNLWAKMQLTIQIMAPSRESFVKLVEENAINIERQIQNAELERVMDSYKKSQESSIRAHLKEKHFVDLIVPKGYTINSEGDNFIWLDNRHRDVIEGVLVYYYPYTDTNTFTNKYLIDKRNKILQLHIPGETKGSYAQTEMRFPVTTSEYMLNGKRFTYEMRGLWHVVNGNAMGGSFISITQIDEARQRVVTVDAFLFAPSADKRNLLKRLEAVIYTLEFVEPAE